MESQHCADYQKLKMRLGDCLNGHTFNEASFDKDWALACLIVLCAAYKSMWCEIVQWQVKLNILKAIYHWSNKKAINRINIVVADYSIILGKTVCT